MKKIDYLVIMVFIIIYLLLLFIFKKDIFKYRFNKKVVERYLCSQDIPYEPPCERVIVSDDEIHIGAGYLYAKGEDPSVINFQHMPLIAYLYGYTSIFFQNPYLLEIFFGCLYLFLTYYIAIKIFKKRKIAILTCFLILIDPLFIDISSQASYELGQAVFSFLYLISLLIWQNWFLSGLFLAFFSASKFYGAAIFFVLLLNFFLFLKRKFHFKFFLKHLLVAFLFFCLVYLKSFINKGLGFNIFLFQLKVIKFWLDHSLTNLPFSSIILFLTGFFKKWWGDYQFTFSHIWTVAWPISFIAQIIIIKIVLFKKNKIISKINLQTLVFVFSPLYLIYLGSQAPFIRYFVIFLPFSYLSLSYFLVDILLKNQRLKIFFKSKN